MSQKSKRPKLGTPLRSIRIFTKKMKRYPTQGIPLRLAHATKTGFVVTRSSKTTVYLCKSIFEVCRTVLGGPVKTNPPKPTFNLDYTKTLRPRELAKYFKKYEYMIVPLDFLRLILKYEEMFKNNGQYAGLSLQEFLKKTWGK